MLSYQHAYHAGGPADVHKHAALCAIAAHLGRKPKPFCLIDVFAGEGIYDLTDAPALKTGEFQRGIAALREPDTTTPRAVSALLAHVQGLNASGPLVRYPGSPSVLRSFLRDDDRLIVNELHPAAARALRRWMRGDRRVAVHMRDGLESLTALTPPEIRRGMIVVDPSYEVAGDYAATAKAVIRAATKWAEGIFVVWYPLLADERHRPLIDLMDKDLALPVFTSELMFDVPGLADSPNLGLRGSGLAVINPPWQLDHALEENGRWFATALPLGPGARHTLRWIHPAT